MESSVSKESCRRFESGCTDTHDDDDDDYDDDRRGSDGSSNAAANKAKWKLFQEDWQLTVRQRSTVLFGFLCEVFMGGCECGRKIRTSTGSVNSCEDGTNTSVCRELLSKIRYVSGIR